MRREKNYFQRKKKDSFRVTEVCSLGSTSLETISHRLFNSCRRRMRLFTATSGVEWRYRTSSEVFQEAAYYQKKKKKKWDETEPHRHHIGGGSESGEKLSGRAEHPLPTPNPLSLIYKDNATHRESRPHITVRNVNQGENYSCFKGELQLFKGMFIYLNV